MESHAYGMRMPPGGQHVTTAPPYEIARMAKMKSYAASSISGTPAYTRHSPMPKHEPMGAPIIGNQASFLERFFQRLWNFIVAA